MSEENIRAAARGLFASIPSPGDETMHQEKCREAAMLVAAEVLLTQFLLDVHRIAEALAAPRSS